MESEHSDDQSGIGGAGCDAQFDIGDESRCLRGRKVQAHAAGGIRGGMLGLGARGDAEARAIVEVARPAVAVEREPQRMELLHVKAGEIIIADAVGEAVAQFTHGGAGEGQRRDGAAAARAEEADRAALVAEGERCVRLLDDLRQVVGRPARAFDLIRLRDLPGGQWNADTLFIRCSGVDDAQLQRMARERWHGEVEVVPPDEARDRGNDIRQRIITVWWD